MSKSDSAKRNLKQAEESLKTGLLKWKPDHTLAAMYYKKAAEDFKALKKYEESNKYFAQANVSTMQVNDLYSAAKNHEAMAQNCKLQCETGPGYGKKFFTDALLNEFMTNLQKAGQYFVQNDNLDSCFHILNRGANAIDNQISQMAYSGGKNLDLGKVGKMTESCCQLLHQAKDALIPQKLERSQDICSNISLIVKIYLRLYNLTGNEKIFEKILPLMLERNHYHAVSTIECKINPGKLGTYATEIVLIHLANDDFISANRYWNAVINCPTDINTAVTGIKSIDEAKIIADAVVNNHGYQVMNNLINFWEDDNGPKCQETLKSYYFKNLETEFVKMVQNLKTIPTGSGTALEPGQEKEVDLQNVNDLGDFEDNLQDDFADQLDLATEIVQEEEEDDDDLL